MNRCDVCERQIPDWQGGWCQQCIDLERLEDE